VREGERRGMAVPEWTSQYETTMPQIGGNTSWMGA